MPRLVVVVDKDCEGRIWEYVFSEEINVKQMLKKASARKPRHYMLLRDYCNVRSYR